MNKTQHTLKWSRLKGTRKQFELSAGNEKIGTLAWQKIFGSLAKAETPDGTWTFKRSGFIRPRVTVRIADTDHDIAVYTPAWMGDGTLQFETGERFIWNKQDSGNPSGRSSTRPAGKLS